MRPNHHDKWLWCLFRDDDSSFRDDDSGGQGR